MCVFNTTAAELLDDLMLLDVKPTARQGCKACMLHTNVLHIPSPLTRYSCSFCRHCSSSSSFLRQASVCRADGLDGTRAGTFACIHRAWVPWAHVWAQKGPIEEAYRVRAAYREDLRGNPGEASHDPCLGEDHRASHVPYQEVVPYPAAVHPFLQTLSREVEESNQHQRAEIAGRRLQRQFEARHDDGDTQGWRMAREGVETS